MSVRLKISSSQWQNLSSRLLTLDQNENAAFLLCGRSQYLDNTDLLVRDIVDVPLSGYISRLPFHLEIHPDEINKVVSMAAEMNYTIVMVHSHPGSNEARFSRSDDAGEQRLMPVLTGLVPAPHGSLVITPTDWSGRIWWERESVPMDRLLVVGPRMLTPGRQRITTSDTPSGIFERQNRVWGLQGQSTISELKVGIVGLGGTGSCVAEEIRRLGVLDLILVDPDVLEATNLSRMYGTSARSSLGQSKVSIVADHLEGLLPIRASIVSIADTVTNEATLRRLRDRDVIMCCTDTLVSRAVLNRFAYQYMIPVIDMGVRIDARGSVLQGASGRVSVTGVDVTCLRCSGHLDPDLLREELTPKDEYSRLSAEGYIRGTGDPEPQVVSLNSTAASLAVTAMIGQMTGLFEPAPEQMYDVVSGSVFPVKAVHKINCDVCGPCGLRGMGDALPASPVA